MKIAPTILSAILFLAAASAITAGADEPTVSSSTPDYYIYQGKPVQMQLDPGRLLVRYAPDATALERSGMLAKGAIGLAAEVTAETAHWQMLGTPMDGSAAVNSTIDALTALPQVAFVSPVFDAPYGGWVTMTPEIMIRIKPEYLAEADAIIAELVPGVEIISRNFADLPGTYYLRTAFHNGYDVLAQANELSLDLRVKWAEPDMMVQVLLGNDETEPHDPDALIARDDDPATSSGDGTPQLSATIPNDPYFSSQWWLKNTGQFGGAPGVDVGAELAWDITLGSPSVKVLVMDCGIQQDHPDINQDPGKDFTWDSLTSPYGGPVDDCDKHGTPCGGIISAITNNGIGVAGVAPDCKALAARVFQSYAPCSNTNIVVSYSGIISALMWGEAQGARVSTASFSIGSNSSIADAYASTYANGMVHFSSAGNNATSEQSFPAELSYVNAVSAVASSGDLAGFSNYGGWISVSAPGVTILTTDRTAPKGYVSGSDYTYFGGTSAASPCAAGVAAMILSAEPFLTADEVTDKIRCTGLDLGSPGPDVYFGFGMTNAYQGIREPLGSDDDSDGNYDACDNCPDVANADQDDTDWDGQGDACDPCPEDPYDDADADGVCGNIDNCLGTANPTQDDADEDGVGDLCDNCIDIPNPNQADADLDGVGDLCEPCCVGIRGNANGDEEGNINISDVTYLVDYLFGIPLGPEPSCPEEGNANGDGAEVVNISDITYLVEYLFGVPLGPAPPACP